MLGLVLHPGATFILLHVKGRAEAVVRDSSERRLVAYGGVVLNPEGLFRDEG
jgi:hypothetical protein